MPAVRALAYGVWFGLSGTTENRTRTRKSFSLTSSTETLLDCKWSCIERGKQGQERDAHYYVIYRGPSKVIAFRSGLNFVPLLSEFRDMLEACNCGTQTTATPLRFLLLYLRPEVL
jgi:hypothetical protein